MTNNNIGGVNSNTNKNEFENEGFEIKKNTLQNLTFHTFEKSQIFNSTAAEIIKK